MRLLGTSDPINDTWLGDIQEVFNFVGWPKADEIDWNYVWGNRNRLSDIHGTKASWENRYQKPKPTNIVRIRPVLSFIDVDNDDDDDPPFSGAMAIRA